ncbi:hypothetical protein DFJ73DRAFT_533851 [Zopfochytrium polystomum]|nr:hypothetical protein DFJ73DRAFT_533851 [Zopfochytrium polystomum]
MPTVHVRQSLGLECTSQPLPPSLQPHQHFMLQAAVTVPEHRISDSAQQQQLQNEQLQRLLALSQRQPTSASHRAPQTFHWDGPTRQAEGGRPSLLAPINLAATSIQMAPETTAMSSTSSAPLSTPPSSPQIIHHYHMVLFAAYYVAMIWTGSFLSIDTATLHQLAAYIERIVAATSSPMSTLLVSLVYLERLRARAFKNPDSHAWWSNLQNQIGGISATSVAVSLPLQPLSALNMSPKVSPSAMVGVLFWNWRRRAAFRSAASSAKCSAPVHDAKTVVCCVYAGRCIYERQRVRLPLMARSDRHTCDRLCCNQTLLSVVSRP